jgi:hypothetical protein
MSNERHIPIPKSALEKILFPVNRLTESCVLKTNKDSIYTVCSSIDNSVILYAKTKLPIEIQDLKLNLINIKKFLTGLECLGEGGTFELIHKNNHLTCKSSNEVTKENTHFKYHLVDDNIIKESTINIETIAKLKFNTIFEISAQKVRQIMSAYSFVNEVNKIYFYTKEDQVYAEIDDKTLQNVDNVSMLVSNQFEGEAISNPLSIKIEIFKSLATFKNNITVKINNEYKVFIFQIKDEQNTELKYIISALVK